MFIVYCSIELCVTSIYYSDFIVPKCHLTRTLFSNHGYFMWGLVKETCQILHLVLTIHSWGFYCQRPHTQTHRIHDTCQTRDGFMIGVSVLYINDTFTLFSSYYLPFEILTGWYPKGNRTRGFSLHPLSLTIIRKKKLSFIILFISATSFFKVRTCVHMSSAKMLINGEKQKCLYVITSKISGQLWKCHISDRSPDKIITV